MTFIYLKSYRYSVSVGEYGFWTRISNVIKIYATKYVVWCVRIAWIVI